MHLVTLNKHLQFETVNSTYVQGNDIVKMSALAE